MRTRGGSAWRALVLAGLLVPGAALAQAPSIAGPTAVLPFEVVNGAAALVNDAGDVVVEEYLWGTIRAWLRAADGSVAEYLPEPGCAVRVFDFDEQRRAVGLSYCPGPETITAAYWPAPGVGPTLLGPGRGFSINNAGQFLVYNDADLLLWTLDAAGAPAASEIVARNTEYTNLWYDARLNDAGVIVDGNQIFTPAVGGGWTHSYLPAQNWACAFDISSNGTVVGQVYNDAGESEGFVYSGGTMTILANPLACAASPWVIARGVNHAGWIVGEADCGDPEGAWPVLWAPDGTPTLLPLLPGGAQVGWAMGVNAGGTIVGTANYDPSNPWDLGRPVMWQLQTAPATPEAAVEQATEEIAELATTGAIDTSTAATLTTSLEAVQASLESGNETAAAGQLGAVVHKTEAAINSGKISAEDGQAVIDSASAVRADLKDKKK